MTERERQYDRVARVLDGEPLELTAEQQALLEEVRTDLDALAGLDVGPLPARAKIRARRAALPNSGRRFMLRFAVGTAAAAAILVAAGLQIFAPSGPGQPNSSPIALPEPEAETLVLAMQTDPESQLLIDAAAEIETLESQLSTSEAADLTVDPIDQDLEELDAEIDNLLEEDFDAPSLMEI